MNSPLLVLEVRGRACALLPTAARGHRHWQRPLETAPFRTTGVHVEVRGFCSAMSEYMAASDCLVTKAGRGWKRGAAWPRSMTKAASRACVPGSAKVKGVNLRWFRWTS